MTGMPGIERKFEFDLVVCYCLSLAPYAVLFHSGLHSCCTTHTRLCCACSIMMKESKNTEALFYFYLNQLVVFSYTSPFILVMS